MQAIPWETGKSRPEGYGSVSSGRQYKRLTDLSNESALYLIV